MSMILANRIERALLDFGVDSADILTQDADHHKLHAPDEEHKARRQPLSGKWRGPAEPDHEQDQGQEHAQRRGAHPQPERKL